VLVKRAVKLGSAFHLIVRFRKTGSFWEGKERTSFLRKGSEDFGGAGGLLGDKRRNMVVASPV
jgi:hypothetical protein